MQKLSAEYDRIGTSYHEAGHVVSALLNYMYVSSVSIVHEERIGGTTYFLSLLDTEKKDMISKNLELKILEKEIFVRYAGLVAERFNYKNLCGSSKYPRIMTEGSYIDIEDIAKIIKKLSAPGIERKKLKTKLYKKSHKQIEQNWDAVVAIAHILFKRKRINYEEIKKTIIRKSKKKIFWKEHFKQLELIYLSSPETFDIFTFEQTHC